MKYCCDAILYDKIDRIDKIGKIGKIYLDNNINVFYHKKYNPYMDNND